MKFFWTVLVLMAPMGASARVFNFNTETFAAYFAGSAGQSGLGSSAFKNEATTSITYDEDVKYNYSGEFGFVYSRPLMNLRFGFEALMPTLVEATANNGTDDLYTVSSDVLGYVPKLTVEINLRAGPQSRSFIGATVGSASITLKNDYTMTAAGTAAYPTADTAMEAKGTGTLYGLSMGYEGIMTDTTTVMFELGYRYLMIDNLAYSKDRQGFNGAVVSGDPVLTADGKQRELDLSGVFISLGFRFYL